MNMTLKYLFKYVLLMVPIPRSFLLAGALMSLLLQGMKLWNGNPHPTLS